MARLRTKIVRAQPCVQNLRRDFLPQADPKTLQLLCANGAVAQSEWYAHSPRILRDAHPRSRAPICAPHAHCTKDPDPPSTPRSDTVRAPHPLTRADTPATRRASLSVPRWCYAAPWCGSSHPIALRVRADNPAIEYRPPNTTPEPLPRRAVTPLSIPEVSHVVLARHPRLGR